MLNAAALDRHAIEAAIEALIGLLDVIDGDADSEDDNADCCRAGDDDIAHGGGFRFGPGDGYPGDGDDAEPEYRRGSQPRYGVDQRSLLSDHGTLGLWALNVDTGATVVAR